MLYGLTALWSFSLLGLCALIGFEGERAWLTQLAGLAIVGAALLVPPSFAPGRWISAAMAAAGILLGGFGLVGAARALHAALLATFFLAGRSLIAAISRLATRSGPVAEGSGAYVLNGSPVRTDLVAREFARARRFERPLSVASISVGFGPGRRGRGPRTLARMMGRELRATDLLILGTADRLLILFPDTAVDDTRRLIDRLADLLPTASGTLLVGTASFPDDAVTWDELKHIARSNETAYDPARSSGPSEIDSPWPAAESQS